VVELVDTPGLGPGVARREGSSPFSPTMMRLCMEQHEQKILNPEPAPSASFEEAAGGLGLCVGFIIENARNRAKILKYENDGTLEDV
jgi:hypothetical protein